MNQLMKQNITQNSSNKKNNNNNKKMPIKANTFI